ncbi:hypothetical protein WSM22_00340 [Cytophagales bacterium WSM2-2]|nr:hypothetical protein WSM22_00340 [Cytophagales bacterium WSM2-2]
MNRTTFFKVVAILGVVVAIYHVVGIFYPVNDSPPWRHGVFIVVSLFCSYGFIKRPKYFLYFFAVLSVQQFYSHGSDIISTWQEKHNIDWISVALLIAIPFILYNLIVDAKGK